ncbi:glycoside hydrolase family 9 protein [Rheinheimera sp.]|uniref:glycoside hydrolase family 9 protein n=1 Tax=Rheinheimera sp. TaxID=1869214 RepID=UPI00307F9A4F
MMLATWWGRSAAALLVALLLSSCSTTKTTCPTLRLNQLGFAPEQPKLLVLEGSSSVLYQVLDSEGTVLLSGKSDAPKLWPASGRKASVLDLSALTQAGEYRLELEGCAAQTVQIHPAPFAAAHDAAAKAYYFNRASMALTEPYAGPWARAAGHPDHQVRIHQSAASGARPEGTVLSSALGWYDAGDYNKYVVNSGVTLLTLLQAWSDFPAFYRQRSWAIPESGNALPDLVDEVLWNLRWLRSMQDPSDGGVYHKLTNLNFDGTVMPDQANSPRYLVQKTTAAALNYAAVMAKASQVLQEFDAQLPGLAKEYADSAVKAWQWARANPAVIYQQPADVLTGAYGDNRLDDEFATAAAQLFLLTREPAYLQWFAALKVPLQVASWANPVALAYWQLLRSEAVPDRIRQPLKDALLAEAELFLRQEQQSPYRVAMTQPDFIWGSNAVAANKAVLLYQSYLLSGKLAYRQAALNLLDYLFGRNPTGYSFVTGFGRQSPQHIHHRPSEADAVKAPVPGWLAGGPNQGQQDQCVYPSKLPALSYLDDYCSYASNEIAINWNAPLVYLLAAFSADPLR